MTKKHNLFYLILIVCSLTMQAQKKLQSQTEKETQEYLEYMQKLMRFENLEGKGAKTSDIPRPLGLNPSVSMGETTGNIRSWELYRKTLGNQEKTNPNTASKSANTVAAKKPRVVKEKEKPREHINDAAKKAQVITNFGTKKNQSRRIQLKGALVQKGVLAKPTVFRQEKEGNDSFSTAKDIAIGSKEIVRIKGSLKNKKKSGGLSADVDIYKLFLKKGKHYAVDFKNTGNKSFMFKLRLFFENGSSQTIISTAGKISHIFPANGHKGKVYLALQPYKSSISGSSLRDPESVHELGGETTYNITLRERPESYTDKDFYKVQLRKGDVFGIAGKSEFPLEEINFKNFKNGSSVGIANSTYAIEIVKNNPLPTKGDYGFHYMIPNDGTYVFSVKGTFGSYDMNFGVTALV